MDLIQTVLLVFYLLGFVDASPLVNGKRDQELYFYHRNGLRQGYLMVGLVGV